MKKGLAVWNQQKESKFGFLDSKGEEKKIRFLVFAKIGEKRLANCGKKKGREASSAVSV